MLAEFGCQGTAEMFDLAREANEDPPKLRRFDPRGFRLDIVEFHQPIIILWPKAFPPGGMLRPGAAMRDRQQRRRRSSVRLASTWPRRSQPDTCAPSP